MRTIFPLGTVVLLKDSKKRLLIYGRFQKEVSSNKIWDYVGCYYPEGSINSSENFLFNEDQIHKVYFLGFQDYEELLFRQELNKQYENLKK
jgi:hypothetical protein